MPLPDEVVQTSLREIWSMMLGLEIEALPQSAQSPLHDGQPASIEGRIQISGCWNGSVMLTCHQETAISLTRIMFDMDNEVPSDADIRDALGELTNMVGGKIKLSVGEPSTLSLPIVQPHHQAVQTSQVDACTRHYDYCFEGQSLRVHIFESALPNPAPTERLQ